MLGLSDDKLSNNKLSGNNLASEFVEKKGVFKTNHNRVNCCFYD